MKTELRHKILAAMLTIVVMAASISSFADSTTDSRESDASSLVGQGCLLGNPASPNNPIMGHF